MKNPTKENKVKQKYKTLARTKKGKFRKTCYLKLKCRFCGSDKIVKFGYNIIKKEKKPRYKCKECNKKFTPTAELVKPIKFKKGQKDIQENKNKELKKVCKLIKKTIYPFFDFNLHYTAKYQSKNFLDMLIHIAMNRDFTHNGSKTFKIIQDENSPASNTLLYHIRNKFTKEELEETFINVFEEIFKLAKKNNFFKKRKFDVAIDLTDWLYYGDENDPMVCETKHQRGTTHCFRFATINIVEAGRRFTLLALPMSKFSHKLEVIKKLIQYARSKIKIRYVYADRGFFSIKIINYFKNAKLKFVMPAIRDRRIKKLYEHYESPTVIDYTMGRRPNISCAKFKLAFIDDGKGKVVFATNLNITEKTAIHLFDLYDKRWGIETSYRVKNNFKPRTTSKRYVVRLFYFMYSACLYNLWILANIVIGVAILKFIPKEPMITAKIFGTVLYTLIDPGG